jgi:RNA polymerase sigma-70 factor (ECF subfamily)
MENHLEQQLVELLPRLRRYAYGLSGSTDKGDELLQAACERALAKSAQWRPDSRLDHWMFRIIRNIRIDELRSQNIQKRSIDKITPVYEEEYDGRYMLDSQIAAEEVRQAMQYLTEDHRMVLLMVGVEGYAYKEVAEILEIPIGTVTSRLIRARRALLKKLSEQGGGSETKEAAL